MIETIAAFTVIGAGCGFGLGVAYTRWYDRWTARLKQKAASPLDKDTKLIVARDIEHWEKMAEARRAEAAARRAKDEQFLKEEGDDLRR